jgi:hypothetical protein
MTTRTTHSTITFRQSFRLGLHGEEFPAGRYLVETEEELIQGMSFPAYQRTATMVHLLPNPQRPGVKEVALVDHELLQAALAEDNTRATANTIDPSNIEP